MIQKFSGRELKVFSASEIEFKTHCRVESASEQNGLVSWLFVSLNRTSLSNVDWTGEFKSSLIKRKIFERI